MNNGTSRVVKNDLRRLNDFVSGLENVNRLRVRVGILGNKAARADRNKTGAFSKFLGRRKMTLEKSDLTNADLGAIHEFGSFTRHIPARSFLRLPLHQRTRQILSEVVDGAEELLAKGETRALLIRLGFACENAVRAAFGSRGFGLWKVNRPSTIRRKGSSQPLIDTAQLRRSITSDVVGGGAES